MRYDGPGNSICLWVYGACAFYDDRGYCTAVGVVIVTGCYGREMKYGF